ncbi:MAG: hypothetical protein ACQESA_03135 [Patescibacteria group bacterium]
MSLEKFEGENQYTNKENNGLKMNRREFLKKAGILTGGLFISEHLLKLMEEEVDKKESFKDLILWK